MGRYSKFGLPCGRNVHGRQPQDTDSDKCHQSESTSDEETEALFSTPTIGAIDPHFQFQGYESDKPVTTEVSQWYNYNSC